MKFTNNKNLPEAFARAVMDHEHRKGDFSVTELLKGAPEIALSRVLDDKLTDDVADRFWAIMGTAVHKVLEEASPESEYVSTEVYMYSECCPPYRISGMADFIDHANKVIIDYKTCSAWKFRLDDEDYKDWRNQLKAYCYLARMTYGVSYLKGQIVAILRDWSQTEALRNRDYPQSPVQTVDFSFTADEVMNVPFEWGEKIGEVEHCLSVIKENGLEACPMCSDADCWKTDDTYAVMKEGRKSAVRVYPTKEEALELVEADDTGKYFLQFRQGEYKKCSRYCIVGKNGYCRGKLAHEPEEEQDIPSV